jgi:hypothetical protein
VRENSLKIGTTMLKAEINPPIIIFVKPGDDGVMENFF